jgi:3-(3-hydroxy-phenyl)propionate hydroxylase
MAVEAKRFDVVVIGAGPTGLTLTNYLGQAGVSVLLLEKLPHIIDYPRGVGVDDEACARSRRSGSTRKCAAMTPFHAARFIRRRQGPGDDRSHPDAVRLGPPQCVQSAAGRSRTCLGLSRFPCRDPVRGRRVRSVADVGGQAVVTMADGSTVAADYLVGCDGGRSIARNHGGFLRWQDRAQTVHRRRCRQRSDRPPQSRLCAPSDPTAGVDRPAGTDPPL